MENELYDRLGVAPDASLAQIRFAYREKAKTMHPDRGGDPDDFVALTMAYNTLSDPGSREKYDANGLDKITAMEVQTMLLELMSEVMDAALANLQGRKVEESDIVAAMRRMNENALQTAQQEMDGLVYYLKLVGKVRQRIKRKGDGRNLFVEVADRKIETARKEANQIELRLRGLTRMKEELERSESIVDIVNFVNAGAWASHAYASDADQAPRFIWNFGGAT